MTSSLLCRSATQRLDMKSKTACNDLLWKALRKEKIKHNFFQSVVHLNKHMKSPHGDGEAFMMVMRTTYTFTMSIEKK